MTRFYLHVFNSSRAFDTEGCELPDLETATLNAVQGARELIAEDILAGRPISQRHRIEITGEDGRLLHEVCFGDVMQLQP
ncbi:DUF6894 family protein [Sphingomonas aerophila]|jgi:hypothetical protein|uniref:DUF6894 domain-containing protein n=1 Tax=Sphingomonas aerophila TaxID=1344948 RepID=A0A7W9BGW0_9SPHN|nr:hypothetical protein [Sphingomonas aerophila]MBB5717000.1 hypothetical protein [Sphingomonas aerophila]